jgi:DMSO/TMAO reductase YedYZ molybdopterin-dependent catalytic subunit
MSRDGARIFKLLERGDNFVKYARPGTEQRATERARKRYLKAAELAEVSGDEDSLRLARIRLEDLERFAAEPRAVESMVASWDEAAGVMAASVPEHAAERVPPGQRVTSGWPTLHEGPIPRFDPETWRFRVEGSVREPFELTYEELHSFENHRMRSDFHCVTGWSKLDNTWDGVRPRDLLARARPRPDAHFVTVGAEYGYTANLPLEALLEDDVLLAWGHNGSDLVPKHGWPLRLVVPQLYGWKSVKWVTSIAPAERDRRGFWEVRGYHNEADPWLEQRYSYQE